MRKYIFLLIFLMFGSGAKAVRDAEIGEEFIVPLRFPKFSLSGEYAYGRKFHGFADDTLRGDIKSRYETALSFEAGLVKYFNAGGLFSVSMSSLREKEPLTLRMGLFGKPFIPIGNRVAIFGRLGLGLAVDLAFEPAIIYYNKSNADAFKQIYGQQTYHGWPFGGYGSATIGLEVFPFSRFGLAFEWGIRSMLLHGRRSMPLFNAPENVSGAPAHFNYMVYDMPIMATLHIVL